LVLAQETPSQPVPPAADSPQPPAQNAQPASSAQPSTGEPASAQSPGTPAPETKKPDDKAQPQSSATTTTSTPKPAVKKRRHKKRTAVSQAPTPDKKVVKNGGTADPAVQLSPGVSDEQASRERQSTTQLLSTTDKNLKQLSGRQLNGTQQDSVSQIQKYMEQAKAAEAKGDVQRAQNLASKALMLSDDLVKH
jgi:hypothetical protein